jgi:hypothetical protein
MFTDVERTGQIYEKITDFLENIRKFGRINANEFEPEIFRMLMGFSEIFHTLKFEYKFRVVRFEIFTAVIMKNAVF